MNWYAVYTRSRHEQKVYGRLLKKNIETFLPLMERWSRRRDRRKRITLPLFPGYLFVRVLMDACAEVDILKTDGVVRVLGNNGMPIPIPDEEIFAVRTLIGSGMSAAPCAYLKEGMTVRVVNGPLIGIDGILLKTQPQKNHLVISVHLLKESVSVEIEDSDVEPVFM